MTKKNPIGTPISDASAPITVMTLEMNRRARVTA
jgi:hypothetical protein